MTADLQPYPVYKDSGLPWLGRIPAHWGLRRAKYLYREVDERSQTGEEELCSVSHKTGVTPRKENVTMFMAESTVGYKICRPNDLAINTLWAWMAALGISRQVGVVSPAYGVYRPLPDSELLPDFADRLLRIEEYKAEYIARSTGVNASRLRLYPDQFLRIPVLLPTQEEQEGIARYLEGMDRSVRRFIRNRRRLIEVLNEQKQAIINRAVTRGLDPNAPLKPSGVEWLGEIPRHWEVRKLKHLTQFLNGLPFKPSDWKPSGVPIIRIQNLNGSKEFNYTDKESLPADLLIRTGDLMFAWSGNRGTSFGSFEWPHSFPGYLNQHIFKLVGFTLPKRYFYYLLRAVTKYVEEQAGGIIGLVHVTKPALGSVRVPVAPEVEAESIARHIDTQTASINAAIDKAQREIELVREYRTRLIADVVTGKVDVRGLAPTEPLSVEAESDVDIEDEAIPEDGEEVANDVD
jgi:type I restriction enzyme, S subunit